jgi:ferric-dicitrate binding protein FerR (iron transport regulator)
MKKHEIDRLIIKLIDNSISDEESDKLATWLEKTENLRYFNEFIELNHLINSQRKFDHSYSLRKFVETTQSKSKHLNMRLFYAAASVVILISVVFFFNKRDTGNNITPPVIVNNNIKIGTDKATLTLENGTVIPLEKGQKYISSHLESTGEALVYKSKNTNNPSEVLYNYLTIPRGGQFHVILSDGTEVWLNSETQLKYPVAFVEGETRKVELIYGEAYFAVSPSTEHNGSKFRMLAKGQEVEVLGTEFNVKAYKNEAFIYTTLIEGKVALITLNSSKILTPNDQSVLNTKTNAIAIKQVNTYYETAWKKGLFAFKNKSLKDIMEVLERWYDIEVAFEDETLETVEFKGVLSKNQNIEEILKLIKNTNYINAYEINNSTIIIKK